MLLIYVSFNVIWRVTFNTRAEGFYYYFESLVDIYFVIDIVHAPTNVLPDDSPLEILLFSLLSIKAFVHWSRSSTYTLHSTIVPVTSKVYTQRGEGVASGTYLPATAAPI